MSEPKKKPPRPKVLDLAPDQFTALAELPPEGMEQAGRFPIPDGLHLEDGGAVLLRSAGTRWGMLARVTIIRGDGRDVAELTILSDPFEA